MSIGHTWLPASFIVRPAKPSRVRELKTEDQVFPRAVTFPVGGNQCFAKLRDALPVLITKDELIRVRPAICPNRHRFAAEDEFGAALAKTSPAPDHFFRPPAVTGAIPSFHRLDGDPVANALPVQR